MKFFILIVGCLLLNSCGKSEDFKVNSKSFEGTWLLKKVYSDPGDGSGSYVDVGKNTNYTLTFNADSSVTSNTSFFQLNSLKRYSIIDTVQLKLTFDNTSSQHATIYRYRFNKDTLILNPQCIEGCGLQFIRTKNLK